MKYMALCAIVAAFSIVGCKAKSDCTDCAPKGEVKAVGGDLCEKCPGVQTADNLCAECKAKAAK